MYPNKSYILYYIITLKPVQVSISSISFSSTENEQKIIVSIVLQKLHTQPVVTFKREGGLEDGGPHLLSTGTI